MKTFEHKLWGTLILLADINPGDIIMCRRKINSKSAPFWPYMIDDVKPSVNAGGHLVLKGHFLLPSGDGNPGPYACIARVVEYEGEQYVVGKVMMKGWFDVELKKNLAVMQEAEEMVDWLRSVQSRL
jgi:hypothetical protein